MIPLYNHNSSDTAYEVDDYPYGFRLRTKIKFWLEFDEKKGFRFCSQTLNPKTNRWNNPKKSTYSMIAGNMYLDEENHVVWSALGVYDSGQQALDFIKKFPQTNTTTIKTWALMKAAHNKKLANQEVGANNSEEDIKRHTQEAEDWQELLRVINGQNNEAH